MLLPHPLLHHPKRKPEEEKKKSATTPGMFAGDNSVFGIGNSPQMNILNQQVELQKRIKAYNGTGVKEPNGILGVIETIPHAGKINSLGTLNLRPATRQAWGFPDKMARSLTDAKDSDPAMPDALETAAAQAPRPGRILTQHTGLPPRVTGSGKPGKSGKSS